MTSPSSKPRPTIYDVAREAGVSKSLVSLVLNNSPLVAEAKRKAVRDAIRKLGYRRSQAASSLASNRTRTIGLVIDDFHNPWFVELLSGLRTTMGPHGFHVAVREHFTLGGTTTGSATPRSTPWSWRRNRDGTSRTWAFPRCWRVRGATPSRGPT